MERIRLSFDISESSLDYIQASEIRRKIATRLDNALKCCKIGKGAGGAYNKDIIEIFLMVNNHDEALTVIQTELQEHWLFPLMKITREV
jgi:hypothetical protein